MKRFLTAFGGTLAGGLLIWVVLLVKEAWVDDLEPPPPCVAVEPADELKN